MSILSATEVTIFSDITATVQTIINQKLIEEVQGRITLRTNNYFTTDLCVQDYMVLTLALLLLLVVLKVSLIIILLVEMIFLSISPIEMMDIILFLR